MIDCSVELEIKEHNSGRDYCIIKANDDKNTVEFSFSLKYLCDCVLPEHRNWFLHEVIAQHMKINKDTSFIIKNVDDALKKCEEIRNKVVASGL